jgi:hypothetical protein
MVFVMGKDWCLGRLQHTCTFTDLPIVLVCVFDFLVYSAFDGKVIAAFCIRLHAFPFVLCVCNSFCYCGMSCMRYFRCDIMMVVLL